MSIDTSSTKSLSTFEIDLSLKREKRTISISTSTTTSDLFSFTRQAFDLENDSSIKLLYKGKMIGGGVDVGRHKTSCSCSCNTKSTSPSSPMAFEAPPKKRVKIMVMVTDAGTVQEIATKRSDPLLRGFDNARISAPNSSKELTHPWGPRGGQHKSYKFVRIVECSSHSFGHRPTSTTPHSFHARAFLEKLACDPGIRAIMVERELVVNTLGEMDPVDDRIMQKTEAKGGCLLGYNTNHGLRIDLKLRTKDLAGFRPYDDVVRTLIHELSHNWVGDHNVLFWRNYAQMRLEYLYTHVTLRREGYLTGGKTSIVEAGLETELKSGSNNNNNNMSMDDIQGVVARDAAREAAQHGIPVQFIMPAIEDRCREILAEEEKNGSRMNGNGRMLISSSEEEKDNVDRSSSNAGKDARELALEAAERRRQKR